MSGPAPVYRAVMAAATPVVRWWSRLEVVGEELVPADGPVLVLPNHDSAWDPVVIGVALARRRQVRALAKDSLWRNRGVGWVLDRMGQIRLARGTGDTGALAAAEQVLRDGGCLGVFPEGTVSRGRTMPVRSGAGRLALAVPGTVVVGCRLTGVTDVVRVPRRPRIRVEFLPPVVPTQGESASALARRVMTAVRTGAPPLIPGRARAQAAFRRLVAEHDRDRAA